MAPSFNEAAQAGFGAIYANFMALNSLCSALINSPKTFADQTLMASVSPGYLTLSGPVEAAIPPSYYWTDNDICIIL
jgi:hypothetical protein